MSDDGLASYPLEVRRWTAALLRDEGDAMAAEWQPILESLFTRVEPAGRSTLIDDLLDTLPYIAHQIESGDEHYMSDHLWQLADNGWRHDVPYVVVSRAFRALRRVVNDALGRRDPRGEWIRAAYLAEDQIDDVRLRVSGHYHMFSEQRLRESEMLARFLLNNTQDAIFVVSIDTGDLVQVNASAVRLTGHPAGDLYKRALADLVVPEAAETVREALARCASGMPVRLEALLLVAADGRQVPVGMQVVQVRHEAATRLAQVSMRDLSIEAAVRREHEQEAAYLRAFAADSADAVMVFDPDDRIRFWNRGAEQMFGYTAEEILNRHVTLLMPPETAEQELHQLKALVERDGFVRNVESMRVTKDGRRLVCNITRTAIHDPATGARLGTTGVLRDVSEKRQLEQELSLQTRQLRIINRILEATARSLDRSETYRTIASQMEGLLPFDAMVLGMPEDSRLRVRVLAGDGFLIAGEEVTVGAVQTVCGRALARGEALRIADLEVHPDLGDDDRRLVAAGYRSVLVTPLVYGDAVIGALTLLHHAKGAYTDEDFSLLQHLAGHFAVILENARRFEEERKRSAQYELINRVGASAIASIGEVKQLLQTTVQTVQSDFGYFDVAMYEYDERAAIFRLQAQAGTRRAGLGEGYEQHADLGVFGEVLRAANSYIVRDTATDPHYYDPSPEAATVRSELCVPVRVGSQVLGVLDVESERTNGFDRLDQAALEALAGILARCIQVDQSLRKMRNLQAMRSNIMEAVPSALLVLDAELRVQFVNKRYLQFYDQSVEFILGRLCTEVFPPSLIHESNLLERIDHLRQRLEPSDLREVRYRDFRGAERVADVRLRIITEYETSIVVMLHDATQRAQRMTQMAQLREIGELMQGILDVERLVHAILTCITAGAGLGFNRAALLMLDRAEHRLVERERVGADTIEEAGRIWHDVSHKTRLSDFLEPADEDDDTEPAPPPDRPRREVRLTPADTPLAEWRSTVLLRGDRLPDMPAARALWELMGAPEVVAVPLVTGGALLGMILADNLFTGQPVTDEALNTLTAFANQAGLAIANAQAFGDLERSLDELRRTQEQLLRAEQLAGVGAVAAHVAHEIRNPLVSIGGFARRIQRKAEDTEYVRDRVAIVVKEVARLEQILRNVADFTAPGQPELAPADLNEVVREVLSLQQPVLEEHRIETATELAPDLPVLLVDADKIKQVVLNLVRNAVQAMGSDGTLTLTTQRAEAEGMARLEVLDTGPGVPPDRLEEIFNPFFTNKADGTGLGLAVSQKIVVDHGGTLTCECRPGEGARFVLRLPLAAAVDEVERRAAPEGDSNGA
jgi:PAS domain S-box-containing protein